MTIFTEIDFDWRDHGSVHVLIPRTPDAKRWVHANIPDDAQWFAGGVAVEARYIHDIVDGIILDGLSIN